MAPLEAVVRRLMGRPLGSLPASDSLWGYDREPSEGGRTKPCAPPYRRQALQPTPGLLTDAEIVRALRRFKYDQEFRGPKRVPFRVLAEMAGVSPAIIYKTMQSDLPTRPRKISVRTRAKLSPVITAILDGRLRFRRQKYIWVIEDNVLRPRR